MLPPEVPAHRGPHQDKYRTPPVTTDYEKGYAKIDWRSKASTPAKRNGKSTLDTLAEKADTAKEVYINS